MVTLRIVSNGFKLPHRVIPMGDTLARVEFSSQLDADFFRKHFSWSSFHIVDEAVEAAAAAAPAAPVAPVEAAAAPSAPAAVAAAPRARGSR